MTSLRLLLPLTLLLVAGCDDIGGRASSGFCSDCAVACAPRGMRGCSYGNAVTWGGHVGTYCECGAAPLDGGRP